jgi:hypothetical protein
LSLFKRTARADRSQLQFGDLSVDVIHRKLNKNLRLSVHPPEGRVRVSAPYFVSLNTIRVFIASRLDWIQQQQIRVRALPCEPVHDYKDGERHYFAGRAYGLRITERDAVPSLRLVHDSLELGVRPHSSRDRREAVINEWYRAQLKQTLPDIIEKYELLMGVRVAEFGVKRMKTRWGTCNPVARRIWLNLELAKKPAACLEYVVVHEMTHLLERSHNQRFVKLMDQFMPEWRHCKAELNQSAISQQ